MPEQKTVELIKAWGMNVRGAILVLDSPIADLLIQSGRAKLLDDSEQDKPVSYAKRQRAKMVRE